MPIKDGKPTEPVNDLGISGHAQVVGAFQTLHSKRLWKIAIIMYIFDLPDSIEQLAVGRFGASAKRCAS